MRRALPWIVLGLAALAVLGFGLTRRELDGTTAFYAALAAQIANDGTWMPIEHGGVPYVLKPPLAFWSTAWLFDVFGVNPATSTLVSRVFGLLCVLLVARLGTLRDGPVAGWWAGLVLLLSTAFLENATTMRLDTILVAGLLLSFVALFEREGAWRPWAFYAGVTLATLGKGIPGLLPLLLAPVVWTSPRRVRGTWIAASVLLLPIALWTVGLEVFVGSALAQVGADLATGNAGGFTAWLSSSVEHLLVRPIRSAPHVAGLAVFGLLHLGRELRRGDVPTSRRRGSLLLLLWILLVVIAAAVKPSQRVRYLLPALPALAVAIGAWIAAKRPMWRPLWLPGVLLFLGIATWIMPDAWWPANHRSGDARAAMRAAVAAEVEAAERVLLIEADAGVGYGRQWAGRDWAYLHLRREVAAIDLRTASRHAGRLALVHHTSFAHVPDALWDHEIARTPNARLVRIGRALSAADSATTGR